MNIIKYLLCFLLLGSFSMVTLWAQSSNPVSGGNASGTGGSVSYSVGQIVYTTNIGTSGTVSQGVQQPYEISVVTAIKNTDEIILECLVFPNPTMGHLKLVVKTQDFGRLRFQVYNLNGVRIQDKKIDNEETEIFMDSLLPTTYILKVLSGNREIKTFKIIKY